MYNMSLLYLNLKELLPYLSQLLRWGIQGHHGPLVHLLTAFVQTYTQLSWVVPRKVEILLSPGYRLRCRRRRTTKNLILAITFSFLDRFCSYLHFLWQHLSTDICHCDLDLQMTFTLVSVSLENFNIGHNFLMENLNVDHNLFICWRIFSLAVWWKAMLLLSAGSRLHHHYCCTTKIFNIGHNVFISSQILFILIHNVP